MNYVSHFCLEIVVAKQDNVLNLLMMNQFLSKLIFSHRVVIMKLSLVTILDFY